MSTMLEWTSKASMYAAELSFGMVIVGSGGGVVGGLGGLHCPPPDTYSAATLHTSEERIIRFIRLFTDEFADVVRWGVVRWGVVRWGVVR